MAAILFRPQCVKMSVIYIGEIDSTRGRNNSHQDDLLPPEVASCIKYYDLLKSAVYVIYSIPRHHFTIDPKKYEFDIEPYFRSVQLTFPICLGYPCNDLIQSMLLHEPPAIGIFNISNYYI